MKRYFLLSLLTIFFSKLVGQDVFYQTLGSKQGLSQSSAVSIWQDKIGKIWIGNDALNSFDGEVVSVFRLSEHLVGVEDSYIHALCGNDSVLFLLAEGQVVCFDLTMETFSLPGIQTQSICHSKGYLYYVSEGSFSEYDWRSNTSRVIATLPYRIESSQSILEVEEGVFWVGTSSGIFEISLKEKAVGNHFLPHQQIGHLYKDSKGYTWIVSQFRQIYLSTPDKQIKPLTIKNSRQKALLSNHIYCIQEDVKGSVWIGTISGIYQLTRDDSEDEFLFRHHLLKESIIYSLFSDRQGTLWIGSYYGDVRYFNPETDNYLYYATNDQEPQSLHGAIIGKIAEDKKGNIYLATEGSGINIKKVGSDTFEHLTTNNGLPQNKIRHIWYDEENDRLFIGLYMEGVCYLDLKTNRIHLVDNSPLVTVNQRIIETFLPYKNYLVLRTQNGLFKLDRNTLQITRFFGDKELDDLCSGIIRAIHIDDREILWVSVFRQGLFTIDLKSHKILANYGDGITQRNIIPSAVISIAGDSKRGLYFATLKSGILKYDFSKDNFYCFNEEHRRLVSNICYNVAFSPSGNLIVTSNKGVSIIQVGFDNSTHILHHIGISPFSSLMALIGDCGLYVSSEDLVYVGGLYGLLCFSEKELVTGQDNYSLYFSSLQVNNKPVNPTSALLGKNLYLVDKLTLPFRQNTLSINFASSNYLSSRATSYEYRLEGLDEYWTETSYNTIIYNSLRPGNYKLTVREVANTTKMAELYITVRPPFWATLPAILMYIFAGAFSLWWIIRFNKSKTMLQATLELERRETSRIEETNRNKMDFFVNISNEFRTPITLIVSQLDRLPPDIPLTVRNRVEKVKRQASRLQDLITEMLDFRKMEQKQFKLKIGQHDINRLLQAIYDTFLDFAQEKHLAFKFNHLNEAVPLWYDQWQMQKVFYNLLTFLFKVSSAKDVITLSIHKATGYTKIQITHQGIIVPEAGSKALLEMLNSNEASNISSLPDGAIGLAFCKNVILLHKGTVSVRQENGKTWIIITMPAGTAHIDMNDITEEAEVLIPTQPVPQIINELADNDPFWKEELEKTKKKSYHMVVIEEEQEMCALFRETFSLLYEVTVFSDAESAGGYIIEKQPDIIVSEINLPGISGIELCSMIKSNVHTCHIPVVLLSSQPSEQQNVESIRCWADYYFAIPFNIRILLLRCNYLVKSRQKLTAPTGKDDSSEMVEMATNEKEQEILRMAIAIAEENWNDPAFDTAVWYEKLGIGRTRFFSQIKKITGMTPNDYLLHLKMNKSRRLLSENNDQTIAEVAYRLGFSSPAYFSKCFKKQFGITPQEYRRKN
ncbi:MAG: helix-turn-helix domain-containing protein [Tannerellaceae bacterium]|jgi:signal transduction histidine kinase/ligand-binding sensor domain-containing protein/AraC-like DNA-binding protein|nr:helix-turn-helix domain-containing protein [Tannerellaceae bacterium]